MANTTNITIVTGFFSMPSKFSDETYHKWIKNFLCLRENMIIFTDKENITFINNHRNISTSHVILTTIENFSTYKFLDYWKYCNTIDIEKHSHSPYLYMIWNEKSYFIEKAIELNKFNSEYFFWMDMGCIRDVNMLKCIKKFSSNGIPDDKIVLSRISDNYLSNQLNENKISVSLQNVGDRSCSVINYIQGGFFGGHKNIMKKWTQLYTDELDLFMHTKTFGGKDQYIMNNMSLKYKEYIHCLEPKEYPLFNSWWSFLVRMGEGYKVNKNVLLLGVIKNGEKTIKKNMDMLLETSKIFDKCKILVYENNSTDNTKQILSEYKNNISIISEDLSNEYIKTNSKIWAYTKITGSDHPCRIEWIANARNKLVSEIRKSEYNEYSHVIWFDIDSNGWDIGGIYDSFQKKEWDAIFANGLGCGGKGEYYDYYALRMKNFEFGPEILGEHWWNNLYTSKPQVIKSENELIPVYSAFAGIGIYKKEIFDKIDYTCTITEDVYNVYKKLLKEYGNIYINNIAKNPCKKFGEGVYMYDNSIQLKKNSGYDNPICCEHVGLHFTMTEKGYSKMYINPKLKYYCGL